MSLIRLVVVTVLVASLASAAFADNVDYSGKHRRGTRRGNKPHKELKHEPIFVSPEVSKGEGAAVKGIGARAEAREKILKSDGAAKPSSNPKTADKKADKKNKGKGKGKASGKR